MTKTIGPREAALRLQREDAQKMLKASRLPVVLSDPPPFGLGPDWKDKPAKAKAAFEAARTIPAVKPKAPKGRNRRRPMNAKLSNDGSDLPAILARKDTATPALDRNEGKLGEFLAKRRSQTLPSQQPTAEKPAETAPAAKPAEKAKDAPKAKPKGKTPAAKKTKPATPPAKKAAAKKAPTKPATSRSGYDWEKAETGAKAGKVPAMPPFASYKPHMEDVAKFAKAKDAPAIKTYLKDFKDEKGGRANLFRYARLCITALAV